MREIIALCGIKGSGKDEVALALPHFKNIKFASPIKDMSRVMFRAQGLEEDEIDKYVDGDSKEMETYYLNGKSCRHLQQVLGTEMGRDLISENIWCDIAERAIKNSTGNVIVTDMRFPNEFAMLKRLGAITVRIEREIEDNEYSSHESEKYIAGFNVDVVIKNDSSIDMLHKMAVAMIVRLNEERAQQEKV